MLVVLGEGSDGETAVKRCTQQPTSTYDFHHTDKRKSGWLCVQRGLSQELHTERNACVSTALNPEKQPVQPRYKTSIGACAQHWVTYAHNYRTQT
ncbi:hypothetical protein Q5P01_003811 [Channa striata]|uniref:Uncharacterized protein n=1 Tax=Channa striata TaxID=64152 RepID=A0AA88NN25_CHASR|nr:hypothetical protein Q5P01_003811 [Channa striata]